MPEIYFLCSIYFIFFFFTLRNYSSILCYLTDDKIIYILYLCTIIFTIILLCNDIQYQFIYADGFVTKTYVSNWISVILFIFFFFLVFLVQNYFTYLALSCGVYLFVIGNAVFCLSCLIHATDFFFAFILLECVSICLYLLCGYNKRDIDSIESALKYFMIGTFSSIILLLGIVFLYGMYDTLKIEDLKMLFQFENIKIAFKFEVITALVFISLGLLIKVYSAPLHYWAIDIYEGAPLTSSFFFSTIYLSSIVFFFYKVHISLFMQFEFFQYYFLFFAINCLFFGTYGSIFQRKIRKLIAYSSVNTIGFVLLAFSTFDLECLNNSFYFFFTYIFNSICIFMTLIYIKMISASGIRTIQKLSDFSILYSSNTSIALAVVTIFFFSSGIPPFLYFISKSFVLNSVLANYYFFYIVFLTLLTLFSYYYFVRLIKIIYYNTSNTNKDFYGLSKLSVLDSLIYSSSIFINILLVFFFDYFSDLFVLFILSI